MRLLITGAASFVGLELIKQCQQTGIEFVGLDATTASPGTIEADIRDPHLSNLIPDGIDAVVHLAAISRDLDCRRDPVQCYDVNVAGTVNVFEACRAKGARQFIFASTEWVYDSFDAQVAKLESDTVDSAKLTSDYALSKVAAESALRIRHLQTEMPVTVLRFGIIYGPRQANWSAVEQLLATVAAGEPVKVGSRGTARCFVHVSDIARGILAAVGCKGYEVINIQGDAPVTLGEVVVRSGRLLGQNPVIVETNSGAPSVRNVSNAKARAMLGWHPEVDLFEGLKSVAIFLKLLN